MTGKSTNLHITRFLAAVLVIFSHSFALTQGNGDQEWLWILTGGQLDMGALAVSVFFFVWRISHSKEYEQVYRIL